MIGPLHVALSADHSRAAFRLRDRKGNIVTESMIQALLQALDGVAQNPHLKLITLEGEGPDFSFGASIPEHAPGEIDRVLPAAHRLIEAWLAAPAVTVALVRGRCLGGGFELALSCDLMFAEQSATLGLPEIALGVFPPAGAAILPWRIGGASATAAIVTGEIRPAAWWAARGLLEAVTPDGTLAETLDRWYDTHLAPRSAAALRYACAASRLGLQQHVRAVLPVLERLYLDDLMKSEDAAEGVRAFLEKRRPVWTDR